MKTKEIAKVIAAGSLFLLLLAGCAAEPQKDAPSTDSADAVPSSDTVAVDESQEDTTDTTPASDAAAVDKSQDDAPATDAAAVDESQITWETQTYEDDYLSYEIPANWQKHENSNDEMRLTLFTEKEPATEMPSNICVQILSLQSQSKDFDYADPEIQELYHQFLLSPDARLVAEAQDGEYVAEQIGGTWVYSLSLTRETDDGTMVRQTGYFPMGLEYSLVIWATDYQDGCTPPVEEIAKHICETLCILEP